MVMLSSCPVNRKSIRTIRDILADLQNKIILTGQVILTSFHIFQLKYQEVTKTQFFISDSFCIFCHTFSADLSHKVTL